MAIPDGIKIRPATLADLEPFRQLRLEALQNHPTAFGQDYDEIVLRPPSYWEQTLRINNEERNIFLAQDKNDLIGMAGIARGLTKKIRHSASIWGIYVRPGWRGRHISELLIQACLDWANKNRVIVVNLAVVTKRTRLQSKFMSAVDFAPMGLSPRQYFMMASFMMNI